MLRGVKSLKAVVGADALQVTPEKSTAQYGRREYEFIAEVTSAPPSSVFRLTKV